MARIARRVLPGFPHHITQRGTDRQNVFYSLKDRRVYLELLKENSGRSAHLLDMQFCASEGGVEQWAGLPGASGHELETKRLRRATYGGNPLGSEEFVAKAKVLLAQQNARLLERKGPGREGSLPLASRAGIWSSGGL